MQFSNAMRECVPETCALWQSVKYRHLPAYAIHMTTTDLFDFVMPLTPQFVASDPFRTAPITLSKRDLIRLCRSASKRTVCARASQCDHRARRRDSGHKVTSTVLQEKHQRGFDGAREFDRLRIGLRVQNR